jgi:hypothetical protein
LLSGCGQPTYEIGETYEKIGEIVAMKHTERWYLNPVHNLNPISDIDPTFAFTRPSAPEKYLLTVKVDGKDISFESKALFSSVKVGTRVKVAYGKNYAVYYKGKGNPREKVYVGDLLLGVSAVN